MEYKEEEYLNLAGIQHYLFCRRQWALIHLEQQWAENVLTVEGNILHEKAHDGYTSERRKGIIVSRGVPVFSRSMGINGVCDIVEFHSCQKGISLSGHKDAYQVIPIEYKRGKPKIEDSDRVQLTAQVMCLEEMLCCEIPLSYLYYGETRHRELVEITGEIRKKCRQTYIEMHDLFAKRHTPKVKQNKKCKSCSLRDLCLPELSKQMKVENYISKYIKEGIE